MQELVYGGVPENVKNILLGKTIQREFNNKKMDGLPKVGTKLVKTYQGKEYSVVVSTSGFQLEGKFYKSLSAVAYQITGKKISGRFFFKLGNKNEND